MFVYFSKKRLKLKQNHLTIKSCEISPHEKAAKYMADNVSGG